MPIEYMRKETPAEPMLRMGGISETSSNIPVWSRETSEMARLESGCYNLSYGYKVCWDLDISAERLIVELKWNDTSLGKWILDSTHTCVHIEVLYLGVGILSDIYAAWSEKEVTLKGEIDYLISKKTFDVVIFKW